MQGRGKFRQFKSTKGLGQTNLDFFFENRFPRFFRSFLFRPRHTPRPHSRNLERGARLRRRLLSHKEKNKKLTRKTCSSLETLWGNILCEFAVGNIVSVSKEALVLFILPHVSPVLLIRTALSKTHLIFPSGEFSPARFFCRQLEDPKNWFQSCWWCHGQHCQTFFLPPPPPAAAAAACCHEIIPLITHIALSSSTSVGGRFLFWWCFHAFWTTAIFFEKRKSIFIAWVKYGKQRALLGAYVRGNIHGFAVVQTKNISYAPRARIQIARCGCDQENCSWIRQNVLLKCQKRLYETYLVTLHAPRSLASFCLCRVRRDFWIFKRAASDFFLRCGKRLHVNRNYCRRRISFSPLEAFLCENGVHLK